MTNPHTAIWHTTGPNRACVLDPSINDNATTLRPLAQVVQQLEANKKAFSYAHAMAERYVDASLTINFDGGGTITHKFRSVFIDMAAGRVPRLVFSGSKGDFATLTLSFTDETAHHWLTPRQNAGCTWCGPGYQCNACKDAKAPQPA